MTVRRFVDTNILLYAKDLSEPGKQPVAEALMRELWASRRGRLSVQVLNEYFVNATQKLEPGLTPAQAWSDVEALFAWEPQVMDQRLLSRAFMVRDRHGLSWWDSLIVAAAIAAGCDEILTEDLSAGQVYDGITVVNPFT
jgi:predicted nucleic acid-binding protein